MKQKHNILFSCIFVLILGGLLVWAYQVPALQKFSDPTYVREYLLSWGAWGYFVLIILILLSIPLPIPSTVIVLAGGYVYGTLVGTILSVVGMVFGSILSFYAVKWMGEPLLEKMVDKHHIAHFNHIFKKRGNTAVLISYAIPVFPSDAVSLILGLTNIRFSHFLWLLILGNIPRAVITNSLGQDLYSGFTWVSIISLSLAAVFIVIAIFREKAKFLFFKELHSLRKEERKVEHYFWKN